MKIEFDQAKSDANIARRGLSFEMAAGFDLDGAYIRRDRRRDYGETRSD